MGLGVQKDRRHQQKSTAKKNSHASGSKRATPSKGELHCKNKIHASGSKMTSSNESTHQRDTKSKNKKRRTRTLKDKRPIITNFKQNQTTRHIVKLSLP